MSVRPFSRATGREDYDIEVIRNASVTKLDTKTQNVHFDNSDAQKDQERSQFVFLCAGTISQDAFFQYQLVCEWF